MFRMQECPEDVRFTLAAIIHLGFIDGVGELTR